MILNLYLRKFFTPILVITFALIGVYTFGYAEYFDRWFLLGLVIWGLIKIKSRDVNMAGLLLILILVRLLDEISYLIIDFDIKAIIYLFSVVVIYKLKYDQLVLFFCAPLLTLIVLVELFWFFTGYPAPQIYFYVCLLLLSLITRHLLFMRVPLTDRLTQGGKSLPLDWKFYGLSKWSVFILAAMLAEYLVRHLTILNPLHVYQLYPIFMHVIAVTSLFYLTEDYLRTRFILAA
ncbi:hypothetical protein [Thalassomonas haliotis]|uniref:Intracellular septation protein A n=1 Tax=Thalassomonas haliotis TaxID=485448 RepID=A0ABY7VK19_9GAMM|nr:hypothetical protein [Thalassomonas haliotis]WDE13803.1 hypothetical protein H3N35_10415 [Thalassomonas haliotis]